MNQGNQHQRITVSINEAAALLGVSRSSVYVLIGKGTIKPIKMGRRSLLSRAELEALPDLLRAA